ncbi:MAG: hypothetical protein KDC95_03775 [Planctomycetes bacterium]|nr:hypothetical protein [Planctomycetota bacterium]
MRRLLPELVVASASYGFSIGASHSLTYATRNLVKFPLLILTTTTICAVAYYVIACFLAPRLGFRAVQRFVVVLFRDTSVLLASMSPVMLFLAWTMEPPKSISDLGGYPFFQGINVALIALCGSIALVRGARSLLSEFGIAAHTCVVLMAFWLGLSLVTGGQAAWYMRPFFGISLGGVDAPFFSGTAPDFRGATNFFEAVYNLIAPPSVVR